MLLAEKRKTSNKNDLNQVPDQRFLLKQWVAVGDRSCKLCPLLIKDFKKKCTKTTETASRQGGFV